MYVNGQISSNIFLKKDGYWTYHVNSKSTLYGVGDYQGEFSTSITVVGNGTIKYINSTSLTLEKIQEINFKIEGSGDYNQETKSETQIFTENSVIDLNTYTYLSRVVKGKIGQEEIQDDLIIGMPAIDFISPELSDGQYVGYYSIDGLINCQVSHGEKDYEGTKLQTIILSYSGPTAKDPWLETNGTAKDTYIFEKNTGLLISSSSTTETLGDNGRRVTTYLYELDSTSFWTLNELTQQSLTTSIPSSLETSTEKLIKDYKEDSIVKTDYFIPILIVTIISIIIIVLIEVRRNIFLKNQEDHTESDN